MSGLSGVLNTTWYNIGQQSVARNSRWCDIFVQLLYQLCALVENSKQEKQKIEGINVLSGILGRGDTDWPHTIYRISGLRRAKKMPLHYRRP